jgi:hypothetical protein
LTVREGRTEVLRLRQPLALLGRLAGELGRRRRGLREGLDRVLPRLPEPRPARPHWSLEKFQKYSIEDFEKDVFVDGGVDFGVFQSTYLKQWHTHGFNDIEHNATRIAPGGFEPLTSRL